MQIKKLITKFGAPGNKRVTNQFVCLPGKIKPSSAAHSPPLRVGLHFALSGFIFPGRPTNWLVTRKSNTEILSLRETIRAKRIGVV